MVGGRVYLFSEHRSFAAHLILTQCSRQEVDLLLRTPRLKEVIDVTGFAAFAFLLAEGDFGADLLEVPLVKCAT